MLTELCANSHLTYIVQVSRKSTLGYKIIIFHANTLNSLSQHCDNSFTVVTCSDGWAKRYRVPPVNRSNTRSPGNPNGRNHIETFFPTDGRLRVFAGHDEISINFTAINRPGTYVFYGFLPPVAIAITDRCLRARNAHRSTTRVGCGGRGGNGENGRTVDVDVLLEGVWSACPSLSVCDTAKPFDHRRRNAADRREVSNGRRWRESFPGELLITAAAAAEVGVRRSGGGGEKRGREKNKIKTPADKSPGSGRQGETSLGSRTTRLIDDPNRSSLLPDNSQQPSNPFNVLRLPRTPPNSLAQRR